MGEVPLVGQSQPKDDIFIEAQSAFLVYLGKDGSIVMSPDINTAITVERAPTMQEVWVAVSTVKKNIERDEIAMHAVQMQMQVAQQIAEAQRNMQALPPNLRA